MHALSARVDDVEPSGVVVGVAGFSLGCDGGLHGGPFCAEEFIGSGGGGVTGGAGLEEQEGGEEDGGLEAFEHGRNVP